MTEPKLLEDKTSEKIEAEKDHIPQSNMSNSKSTPLTVATAVLSAAKGLAVGVAIVAIVSSSFQFFYAHSNGIDKKIEYCSKPVDTGYLGLDRQDHKEIMYDVYVEPKGWVYRTRFLSGWNEYSCQDIEQRKRRGMLEMK